MPATMSSASVRLRRIRHLVGYETSGRYSAERGVATRESADDAPRMVTAVSRRRASPKPFDRSVGLLLRLRDDNIVAIAEIAKAVAGTSPPRENASMTGIVRQSFPMHR